MKNMKIALPAMLAILTAATALVSTGQAIAGFCWSYSGLSAVNPEAWVCGPCDNGICPGDIAGQTVRQDHRNWHCGNPVGATEAYGRKFIAFHRQIILDFNNWRLANTGLGRLEIWDANDNDMVPGNDETTSTAFTHCSTAGTRPAGAVCTGCQDLPASFIGNNLNNFNSLGEVGYNLEFSWHGSYHIGVSALGCSDVGTTVNTTRDPAFWMAHGKLDEVARDWQSLQAADVVIVIDRSGSMDNNCPGGTADPGESPCAINDAKVAARTFADTVLDVRLDGGSPAAEQHRIGLVSFSTSATNELGPTSANGIVTDNAMDDTAFEIALAGISAGGVTSIGAGIREAITILNAVVDPNPHQAILVLTDGKENTSPCLGGNSPSNCIPIGPNGTLTAGEIGNIQIVAIGFGPGAEEANLRDVAERHGGVFVAESNVNDPLSLQKFYVTALGEIYDAGVNLDPTETMKPGQFASAPFEINICDGDRLSVVLGREETGLGRECDLELELFTPSGNMVDRLDLDVEAGHGPRYDFIHVNLPYRGESAGLWTGRVVRPPGTGERCPAQDYFYSVLVKGFGRVDPFVVRPDVVVGRNILATFRISESNRPIGDFDSVNAEVTLTRSDGTVQTLPLFDDGTNGDRVAGNNIWSVEFPGPAVEPGAQHLRGHFELTKNLCTQVREAEYSIVVQPEPAICTTLDCGGVIRVRPGEMRLLDDQPCLWNRCVLRDQYEVALSDTRNWLKTADPDTGELVDLPPTFLSGDVDSFALHCFGPDPEQGPIFTVIPLDARVGDASLLTADVRSLNHPAQEVLNCTTIIEVMPPPDCNQNGVDDALDILNGTSEDENGNVVPDECEEHFEATRLSPVLDVTRDSLSWSPIAQSVVYDVVLGDLNTLHGGDGGVGGNFSQATRECLANDYADTVLSYRLSPDRGEGSFFLVRWAVGAVHGTYDSDQAEGRDAGIAASGVDCQ